MITAICTCCGAPADYHEDDYADGAGWFCFDCTPGPKGHAVRVVNEWQASLASVGPVPSRRGRVLPFPRTRRLSLRGAA